MPRVTVVRKVSVIQTPRVLQLEGLFDVPHSKESQESWEVDWPIEEKDWSIGLITGPSGSGKTTLAREIFKGSVIEGYEWPSSKSVLDGFPASMSIRDITTLLSSVGFSSPPSWIRPFNVLSTGEKFRVNVARALAEMPDLVVMDEFTSVVDRTVAQIGSAAVAKAVRKRKQKFIAVSCHYDIIDWLQPDWVYDFRSETFAWRSVQRFPKIDLEVIYTDYKAWRLFSKYHYLSRDIRNNAKCFMALWKDQPVAFAAWAHVVGRGGGYYRGHRLVCLPDFQGVGIGSRLSDYVAGLIAGAHRHKRIFVTSGHPGMIAYHAKSPLWRLYRKVERASESGTVHQKKTLRRNWRENSARRATASFAYCGPKLEEEARSFGLI